MNSSDSSTTSRPRLRELGITIGQMPTGPENAITDVPGVWVGHRTLIWDEPRVARTGVTMVVPREGAIWQNHAFAGFYSFNGNGEMTGLSWLEESGLLTTPIGLTNTHAVGVVRDALVAHAVENRLSRQGWLLPIVAETYDGRLNDIDAFHVTQAHAFEALAAATGGPVPEGNVGGGTGMICHGFKGGIGTASRVVDHPSGRHTVGVLVQANYGDSASLRVDGVPIGRELQQRAVVPSPEGSIIILIATDAPLLPVQCKRLARRATVGLARVGGVGHNGSGDLFLAFATGNDLPVGAAAPLPLQMLPHEHLNPFFTAVAEAVEEAILGALTGAETMTGFRGHTVAALPLAALQELMAKHRSHF
jgi:D-aminopeptidase